MSIKLMSAILDTEFRDLPLHPESDNEEKPRMAKATSIKITMLALADHANDEGECYPGLTKLELKTALSRQGVIDVLSAIKHNGLAFVADEPSKHGSNFYTINLDCFPRLFDRNRTDLLVKPLDYLEEGVVKPLDQGSQATLPELVKPLDLNHQLTIIKPSLTVSTEGKNLSEEDIEQVNKKVDLMLGFAKKGLGVWRGRDWFNDNVLHYADWYFSKTGQVPSQKTKKSWIKAFGEWQDAGLSLDDLEDSRSAMMKWRPVISDPNQLTKDAIAFKAQKSLKENEPEQPQREEGRGFYA